MSLVGKPDRPEPTSLGKRIAFLVQAHGDAVLLHRLCVRLKNHAVFVHMDAKTKEFDPSALSTLPNITLVKDRVEVFWGDYSQVVATFRLIDAALETGERFAKFVLLSGACYPIQSEHAIAAQFAADRDHNYIHLIPVTPGSHLAALTDRRWRMAPLLKSPSSWQMPGAKVIDGLARVVLNKVRSYFTRSFEQEIGGLHRFYGSSWWALSQSCVEYVRDYMISHPDVARAYKASFAPDEQIIHTIIGNSPFVELSDGLKPDLGALSLYEAPIHLVSRSASREFIDSKDDLALILASDRLFARKLSSQRHDCLLTGIDIARHSYNVGSEAAKGARQ